MQSSYWKLTLLAAVLGGGLLAVFYVQRGLSQSGEDAAAAEPEKPHAQSVAATPQPDQPPVQPPVQSEPEPANKAGDDEFTVIPVRSKPQPQPGAAQPQTLPLVPVPETNLPDGSKVAKTEEDVIRGSEHAGSPYEPKPETQGTASKDANAAASPFDSPQTAGDAQPFRRTTEPAVKAASAESNPTESPFSPVPESKVKQAAATSPFDKPALDASQPASQAQGLFDESPIPKKAAATAGPRLAAPVPKKSDEQPAASTPVEKKKDPADGVRISPFPDPGTQGASPNNAEPAAGPTILPKTNPTSPKVDPPKGNGDIDLENPFGRGTDKSDGKAPAGTAKTAPELKEPNPEPRRTVDSSPFHAQPAVKQTPTRTEAPAAGTAVESSAKPDAVTPKSNAPETAVERKPRPEPQPFHHNSTAPTDRLTTGEPAKSAAASGTAATAAQSRRPQLKIEKLAPSTAVLGKPFIYTIVVRNTGDGDAHRVTVEDRVPTTVELTGTIPRAHLSGEKLIWKLGVLKPGEMKKIAVRVIPKAAGSIGSVATVNFVSEVAARTVITAPKIELALDAPKSARVGERIDFTFRVSNRGDGAARDVWLRDVIPGELQHPAGDDLEYNVGELAPGKTVEVTLSMTARKPGAAINRGVVTAAGGVRAETKASVEIVGVKLIVSRSGPKQQLMGRKAVFTNTVTNDSTVPIERAKVTEVIPAGLEFVDAQSGGRFDAATRTVAWQIGRLDPGKSTSLRVTLAPKLQGTHTSVGRVSDGSGGHGEARAELAVAAGVASVGLDVDAARSTMQVGEQATIRLVARNRGTAAAGDVAVQLELPKQFALVGVRGARYTQSGGRIDFDRVDKLPAGTRVGIDVTVKAVATGDAILRMSINAAGRPSLKREEAVVVLPARQ